MTLRKMSWHNGAGILWPDDGIVASRPARRTKPALPPEPTEADLQAYHADTADAVANRRGIPFADIDGVVAAVNLFASNRYRLSEGETIRAMSGDAAVHYLLATASRSVDAFTARVNAEIRSVFDGSAPATAAFRSRDDQGEARFYRSWDHDGPGAFHKTILTVEHRDHGYDLDIYQSYHGDTAERRLADALGLARHFRYCTYQRTFIAEGNRFAIPLTCLAGIVTALGVEVDTHVTARAFMDHQTASVRGSSEACRSFPLAFPNGTARLELNTCRLDRQGLRRGDSDLDLTEIALTGPALIHPNGRAHAVGLTMNLFPEGSPAGESACLQALQRLRDLRPDLKPAHPR